MGFLDEVLADTPRRGPSCTVGVFLANQPDVLRAEVVEALGMPDEVASTAAIWRQCKKLGFTSGQQTIGRHRRGDCGCG